MGLPHFGTKLIHPVFRFGGKYVWLTEMLNNAAQYVEPYARRALADSRSRPDADPVM